MPSLGTIQTKYGKDWIYLNPIPFTGPNTWNVAGANFLASVGQLFGVPPMVIDKVEDAYFLSYSIAACKDLDGNSDQFLVKDAPIVYSDAIENVDDFEGVPPIFTNELDNMTVFFFGIKNLNSVSVVRAESDGSSGYNGNSIASFTTSFPLEATEADSVATVTFDMTTLQDA